MDPVVDEQLATFVVGSHMRSHPDGPLAEDEGNIVESGGDEPFVSAVERAQFDDGPIPLDQHTLKKYIMYSKAYLKPDTKRARLRDQGLIWSQMRSNLD